MQKHRSIMSYYRGWNKKRICYICTYYSNNPNEVYICTKCRKCVCDLCALREHHHPDARNIGLGKFHVKKYNK